MCSGSRGMFDSAPRLPAPGSQQSTCSTSAVVGRRHADAAPERRGEVCWVTVSTFERNVDDAYICMPQQFARPFHSEACQPAEWCFSPMRVTEPNQLKSTTASYACKIAERYGIRYVGSKVIFNSAESRALTAARTASGVDRMTVQQVPRKEVRRTRRVQVWDTITCGARKRQHNLRYAQVYAQPGVMRDAFEYFKAFEPTDAADN